MWWHDKPGRFLAPEEWDSLYSTEICKSGMFHWRNQYTQKPNPAFDLCQFKCVEDLIKDCFLSNYRSRPLLNEEVEEAVSILYGRNLSFLFIDGLLDIQKGKYFIGNYEETIAFIATNKGYIVTHRCLPIFQATELKSAIEFILNEVRSENSI